MSARRPQSGFDGEFGATTIIVAGTIVALMAIAAFVVDLGLIRMHRSEARVVVDAAAAAGALEIREGDGRSACATALTYAEANLETNFAGVDCTTVPAACTNGTPAATTSDSSGAWALTITYPVPDDHPLMSSSVVGSGTQPVDLKDGVHCQRIGVTLVRTGKTVFGGIIGHDTATTEVRATGVTRLGTVPELAVNLVILERYDCDALVIQGGGSAPGGIYIDVVEQADGSITPGHATVDSDGTGAGCGGTDGTLDGDGSNSIIRADGLPGCPQQTGTHIGPNGQPVGESCGKILLYADGTPGCNVPACSTSGTVAPNPNPLLNRVTRAPVDHRYNCKSSYSFPIGWEIRPCPDSPAPYIDNLVLAHGGVGAPAGFTTWSGLGHGCSIEGGGTVVSVDGDIYVDCDPLYVKASLHLTGGDVVFAGDVIIESSGFFSINSKKNGDPFAPGLDSVTVFMRDGALRKAGQATFVAHNTMLYMSASSRLQMAGGTGTLIWTAASTGRFDNLALWSESAFDHAWAGQAFIDLQGIFFSPNATGVYSGNGGQVQVKAQFVTRKLAVSGNGILSVSPRFKSAVLVPKDVVQLIR